MTYATDNLLRVKNLPQDQPYREELIEHWKKEVQAEQDWKWFDMLQKAFK